jgi:hypothetical protein
MTLSDWGDFSKRAWLSHFFEKKFKKTKKVLDKPLKILYCRAVKKKARSVEPLKGRRG